MLTVQVRRWSQAAASLLPPQQEVMAGCTPVMPALSMCVPLAGAC